jgi:hypothetical protein
VPVAVSPPPPLFVVVGEAGVVVVVEIDGSVCVVWVWLWGWVCVCVAVVIVCGCVEVFVVVVLGRVRAGLVVVVGADDVVTDGVVVAPVGHSLLASCTVVCTPCCKFETSVAFTPLSSPTASLKLFSARFAAPHLCAERAVSAFAR